LGRPQSQEESEYRVAVPEPLGQFGDTAHNEVYRLGNHKRGATEKMVHQQHRVSKADGAAQSDIREIQPEDPLITDGRADRRSGIADDDTDVASLITTRP